MGWLPSLSALTSDGLAPDWAKLLLGWSCSGPHMHCLQSPRTFCPSSSSCSARLLLGWSCSGPHMHCLQSPQTFCPSSSSCRARPPQGRSCEGA
eukprot:1157635-Pelagomonas_calceolata.AAC.8